MSTRDWLASAGRGHCGETNGQTDCASANFGSFGWRSTLVGWHDAVLWCSHLCHSCSRCQFISVSLRYRDCSWYRECALDALQQPPNGRWETIRSGAPIAKHSLATATNFSLSPRWREPAPHAKRKALRLKATLPWVQPHDRMSIAVVLFGKVGTWNSASAFVAPDDAADRSAATAARLRGQQRLLEEAHDSFVRHVVRPNPRATVECFAHSWNPSLGATIDRLYQPRESLHERERMAAFGGLPAMSALASIRWALGAKRRHERRREREFELALLMRYDLTFHSRLEWKQLPAAQLWTCLLYTYPSPRDS